MFDWNDEELNNIIWDEAGESDDHIVPYPGQVGEKPSVLFGDTAKNGINQQAINISPVGQKKPTTKSEYAVEPDSSSKSDTGEPATRVGPGSWPDGPVPSSSNDAKADQDSMDIGPSNNITKSSKNGSLIDETTQFVKDSEIFENPPEDGEHGDDFVDYSWANIGSFDDLDRIFSNNDPIFGDASVGHADELWPSSKDVSSTPLGHTHLSGDSSDLRLGALDQSDKKAQQMPDPSQTFICGYEKLNEIAFQAPEDVQGNKQKRLLKGKKSDKKGASRQLRDTGSTWTSSGRQVNSHYAPTIVNPCPPLVLTQQRPLRRPEPFQKSHLSGVPLASPLYGNMVNQYPASSVLAKSHESHAGVERHELLYSGYEVPPADASSLKNSVDAAVKPLTMTPREKIEKLRRRQQMRAILAIQKQQLQFGNHVSVSENSSMEGGRLEADESRSSFPSLEPNSPIEQYDSNTISMALDNSSVEESALYQLQDTIAKLDIRIRLCIRDSLFRLAQSAMKRQYPNDTSGTSTGSRDEVLSNKKIAGYERSTRMPDVETDTNPIDRTVAHLLFHRPLEFSGRPAETPHTPVSANIPHEREGTSGKSLKGHLPEGLENTRMTSNVESKCGEEMKAETSERK